MNHSRYHTRYGPKHSSNLTNRFGITVAVAQTAAAPQVANKSRARVSADPHRQDSESSSQDAPVVRKAEAAVSQWWYFPTIVAVSAISIILGVYLVSISQFGTNMVFMFRNLI